MILENSEMISFSKIKNFFYFNEGNFSANFNINNCLFFDKNIQSSENPFNFIYSRGLVLEVQIVGTTFDIEKPIDEWVIDKN